IDPRHRRAHRDAENGRSVLEFLDPDRRRRRGQRVGTDEQCHHADGDQRPPVPRQCPCVVFHGSLLASSLTRTLHHGRRSIWPRQGLDGTNRSLGRYGGRLPMAAQGEVRAHLEACSNCALVEAVALELTSALEPRLPQRPTSLALKRRIKGGAVGYFLDRKAAVLVYAHGLHTISLFIFRASGLWPARDGSALTTQERGFNVVMWRQSSLGYALVSDVECRELASLAAKLLSM